jgi:SAM-dependent methyltransferase
MTSGPLPFVSATDPAAQDALRELDRRMGEYYNSPAIDAYYGLAQSFNEVWERGTPHAAIRDLVPAGAAVVDMGCGSGHSYANLRDRNVRYTGLDVSARQIEKNAERCGPDATFVAASLYESGLPAGAFDVTFSTFVLEHLVWPHRFLDEVVRVTRPGGLIAIACPHFRPAGRMPSLRYGRSVATLGQRIKSGHLLAAARHYYLRNVRYPRLFAKQFGGGGHEFLINLRPTCLEGAYYPDNDAVYCVWRPEIVARLERLGARDVTAESLAGSGRQEQDFPGVCFVVARKGG